jgi:hypothetical protein
MSPAGPGSDAALVAALRAGDEEAFVQLVALHQASFLRLARVWVRDATGAEEVVQRTWGDRPRITAALRGEVVAEDLALRDPLNVGRSHARFERRLVPMASLDAEEVAETAPVTSWGCECCARRVASSPAPAPAAAAAVAA